MWLKGGVCGHGDSVENWKVSGSVGPKGTKGWVTRAGELYRRETQSETTHLLPKRRAPITLPAAHWGAPGFLTWKWTTCPGTQKNPVKRGPRALGSR